MITDLISVPRTLPSLPAPPVFDPINTNHETCHEASVQLPSELGCTEIEIFRLFFPDTILDTIVNNTNAYANEHLAADPAANPAAPEWRDLTRPVLLRYLAFLIYRGLYPSNRTADYFNEPAEAKGKNAIKPVYPIAKHISPDQVRQLRRYLHVSDHKNVQTDGQRASYYDKVQPLLEHVQLTSKAYYTPKTNVSIDEMIVRFTGRSAHTMRIRGKPTPEGYRILALCDSGYTYAFLPESRIQPNVELKAPQPSLPGDRELNCTSKKVIYMVNQLPTEGRVYNVYMDNFFSSIDLFHNLRRRGIGACGTVRANTKRFPKELKKKGTRLPYNTKSAVKVDDVLALLWMDSGPVIMLTTIHGLHGEEWLVEKLRRKPRETLANKKEVQALFGSNPRKGIAIPRAVNDYNCHMGGVDIADQLRQYYTVQMRTSRTWIPLFLWLLDTSIINAFIIWKLHHRVTSRRAHADFRLMLVTGLLELSYKIERPVETLNTNSARGKQPTLVRSRSQGYITASNNILNAKRHLPGLHLPVMFNDDSDKENDPNHGKDDRRLCVLCRSNALTKAATNPAKKLRSSWKCATCQVPLCLTKDRNCFKDYHTK